MEEQIITLTKLINIQSNKIDSLEKRIAILEGLKKPALEGNTLYNATLFNRLGNKRRGRLSKSVTDALGHL
tara:strand:+ start:207 stop:419 length:213 start_codon:yes stop_codon:yes gene_type:complete